MKRFILTILLAAALVLTAANPARGYDINLVYRNWIGLMDDNYELLPPGSLIQLIFSPDAVISPPNPYDSMPTGNDVLWEWTEIGAGTPGFFSDSYIYTDGLLDQYVYIRYFNATSLDQVTYIGVSPLHQLTEWPFPQQDWWDITEGGLYLYTDTVFVIIPEPGTWLTLLSGGGLGMFLYLRSRKKKRSQ